MEQKLVSIRIKPDEGDSMEGHSMVKEHLTNYLEQGWVIKDFKSLDGSVGGEIGWITAWIIVLLEK